MEDVTPVNKQNCQAQGAPWFKTWLPRHCCVAAVHPFFFDFRHFYCQNLSSYLCDFTNYLQNELLWQNLFLALSFISVRPQEDLRCPALNEEVVHSKVAKTSNTNRLCQLSSWKRQATQTHFFNYLVGIDKQHKHNLSFVNCHVGKDRWQKHLVSIVKLAKTSNTNTFFNC